MPAPSPALNANLSESLPRSPAGGGERVRAAALEQGAEAQPGGFPADVDPPGGGGRGISAAKDFRVASWTVNGLFMAMGYDREQHRGKLRVLRELVDTNDAVALQETHGDVADLSELLKVFPDCIWMGTFADSRNAGGTIVLVRKAFFARAILSCCAGFPVRVGQSYCYSQWPFTACCASTSLVATGSALAVRAIVSLQWQSAT